MGQYRNFAAGYPSHCFSDYIRNEVNIATLQACLGLCSDEAECHFVAYNKLGDKRCGLYKSSCNGQEQTGCTLSQCYTTYTDFDHFPSLASLPTTTTTTTTTTTAPIITYQEYAD